VFATFGFCVIAAGLLACGQGSLSAPQSLPLDVETRATPVKAHREIPRLIAPPPAYGNKIVMAQRAPNVSQN